MKSRISACLALFCSIGLWQASPAQADTGSGLTTLAELSELEEQLTTYRMLHQSLTRKLEHLPRSARQKQIVQHWRATFPYSTRNIGDRDVVEMVRSLVTRVSPQPNSARQGSPASQLEVYLIDRLIVFLNLAAPRALENELWMLFRQIKPLIHPDHRAGFRDSWHAFLSTNQIQTIMLRDEMIHPEIETAVVRELHKGVIDYVNRLRELHQVLSGKAEDFTAGSLQTPLNPELAAPLEKHLIEYESLTRELLSSVRSEIESVTAKMDEITGLIQQKREMLQKPEAFVQEPVRPIIFSLEQDATPESAISEKQPINATVEETETIEQVIEESLEEYIARLLKIRKEKLGLTDQQIRLIHERAQTLQNRRALRNFIRRAASALSQRLNENKPQQCDVLFWEKHVRRIVDSSFQDIHKGPDQ